MLVRILQRLFIVLIVAMLLNVLNCAAAHAQESTPTSPLATPAIDVSHTLTPIAIDDATPTPSTTQTQRVGGADCANVSYGSLTSTEPVTHAISHTASAPNPNGPTAVDVLLHVKSLSDLDASADSYAIEGYMDVIWCDPRLAAGGVATKTLRGAQVEAAWLTLWSPALGFAGLAEPVTVERTELQIRGDGTVQYRAKFQAVMAAEYSLYAFPFDRQHFVLRLRSFTWPSQALVIQSREALVQVPDDLEIPEWRYLGADATVEDTKEDDERFMFSTLSVVFNVQRSPGVYFSKILIPLAVITLLTMAIFWLDGEGFDIRLGGGMTGLLTSIAYQFIASDSLPGYVFNTYLDAFIWMSFIWIVVSLVESGFVAFLHKTERAKLAIKTDGVARWLVPALYLLSLVVLYVIYTRALA
jgi:hypothetical protein